MNRSFTLIFCVSILLLLFSCSDGEKGKAEKPDRKPSPVEVQIVKKGHISEEIVTTGSTLPDEQVALKTEMAGLVRSINFTEGQRVNKGDILLELANDDLKSQKAKAGALLAFQEKNLERLQAIKDENGVSQQAIDEVLTEIKSLQADLDLYSAQIRKTQIIAPFSGRLGLREFSTGAFVSNAQTVVLLARISPLKLEFSVPEKYAQQMLTGKKIMYTTGDLTDTFKAQIYAAEPVVNLNTRTLRVRAIDEKNEAEVVPGTFAKIIITLSDQKLAYMLPTEAIIPELETQKVYMVKNGKAEPREVKTGKRSNRMIEVTEGIEEGDTIVTSGILRLRPNSPVQITKIRN